jgi:DNA-binding PadR family transcriptional regulator
MTEESEGKPTAEAGSLEACSNRAPNAGQRQVRNGAVVRAVLLALARTDSPLTGYDLIRRTKYPSGSVYPALRRMHEAGLLLQLDQDERPKHRSKQCKLYRLSDNGMTRATRIGKKR